MATKLPAAQARLFRNVFVCRNCSLKMRTEALRVISRKVRCRRCGSHVLRPIKSKKK